MTSIWISSADLPHFDDLRGDKKTDVLIIGGGMAGLLCAYFLQKEGIRCALVERKRICSGVTKDTTAKITAQHGLVYYKLLQRAGREKARMYLEANQRAVRDYEKLCRHIDCDFEQKPSYVYSVENRKYLEKEADALRQLGMDSRITDCDRLPFRTAGALEMKGQAQFHPLKFAAGIAEGLSIYENTPVMELKRHLAVTEKGSVQFQKAIFTTHFPIDNKHGMYFLKMYQNRSYAIALEDGPDVGGMYIGETEDGFSFRNYNNYLIVGGGSHRTGKCGGKWEKLRDFAARNYPSLDIKYTWAAQDCMTLDGVPYIGPYAKHMPDCFVATGFQKWGMTGSMAAAGILTDLVLERENPYAAAFSPSRNLLKPQLFVNGWEAARHLLTPSKPRCPHMGCALKWNGAEETWDCPCHGSRFDGKGNLIDNPANGDLF